MQALIDNLIERGLDPSVCRLFIVDGAKALSKVSRRAFGAARADPAACNSAGRVAAPLGTPVSGFMSMRGEKGENKSLHLGMDTVGAPFAATAGSGAMRRRVKTADLSRVSRGACAPLRMQWLLRRTTSAPRLGSELDAANGFLCLGHRSFAQWCLFSRPVQARSFDGYCMFL